MLVKVTRSREPERPPAISTSFSRAMVSRCTARAGFPSAGMVYVPVSGASAEKSLVSMETDLAVMGVVHPDGKHEAPTIVYTFDEKMDIVKLWHNGAEVADVDAWLKSHTNLCAFMIQKDS